jgi:hypothetical protein
MSLESLGLKARLPRIGKIRLGEKAISAKGKEYPKALDYFSFRDVPELAELYGEKDCRSIPRIMLPSELEDEWFQTSWTAYGKSTGIFCRSWDGVVATRTNMGENDPQGTNFIKDRGLQVADGEMFDMPCTGEECPYYIKKRCKKLGRLFFFVLDSPIYGVYEISTTSINSIRNVISAARAIVSTAGRITGIPLTLKLEPAEVAPEGRKKTVWVLNLRFEGGGIRKLLQVAQGPHVAKLPAPQELRALAALADAETPDDLYADGGEALDHSLGAEPSAEPEPDDAPLNDPSELFPEPGEEPAEPSAKPKHQITVENVLRGQANAERNAGKPKPGQQRRSAPQQPAPVAGDDDYLDF